MAVLIEARGLRHEHDGRAVDMAAVDHVDGFTLICDWAEFGQVCAGGAQEWVAACRRLGSSSQEVVTPQGWRYQGSISQRLGALRFEQRRRPSRRLQEVLA